MSTADRYLTVEVYALHIPVSTVDRFYAVSHPVHMNIHIMYGMYVCTHVLTYVWYVHVYAMNVHMCGMYLCVTCT